MLKKHIQLINVCISIFFQKKKKILRETFEFTQEQGKTYLEHNYGRRSLFWNLKT